MSKGNADMASSGNVEIRCTRTDGGKRRCPCVIKKRMK
jgi:hypothetical protein